MGRGGSRYRAGRSGWRRKCEHLLRLDVRVLARRGCLTPPQWFSWRWSRDGEPCGSISLRVVDDHVQFTYTRTPRDSEPKTFDYPVWLDRTPCPYGGSRPWVRCPRCHWRSAVLYGLASDGRFGCRRCMRLAYASEGESPLDRLWRKQRKLENRLGDSGERPKRMRLRTYERICAKIDDIEEAKDAAFCLRAMRLLGWDLASHTR